MGDGRQQERQPRRRSGRVFHRQQTGVLGFGQVFQRLGHRQVLFAEVSPVIIDAHVAVIHRQGVLCAVQLEGGRDVGQLGGSVALEDILCQRPREEGVVDPVENVGLRRGFGQDGAVERRAGVAALDESQFGVVVGFKLAHQVLADREGIVGHHTQRHRPGRGRGGCGGCRRRTAGQHSQRQNSAQQAGNRG